MLAGISSDYYVRMEQGRELHPSAGVVVGLARVFELDDDAVAHLQDLATAPLPRRRAPGRPEQVGEGLLRLLRSWSGQAALVQTRFRDVLACTPLAAAMHPGLLGEPNMLRLLFLHPAQREMYLDWEQVARESVAWLRAAAGADVEHPRLVTLVGELSVQSADFARLWSRHDVRTKASGSRRVQHPEVGGLSVDFEVFTVNDAPHQSLTLYHAAPGTPDADRLALLARTCAPDGTGDPLLFPGGGAPRTRRAAGVPSVVLPDVGRTR